jgi:hypothetical protein
MVREPQTEARGLDRNDRVWLKAPRRSDGLIKPPDKARKMGQHLGKAHYRKLAHWEETFESLAFALRAADTREAHAALGLGPERTHESACEIVA